MRFGLIGCGNIGTIRAAAMARSASAELVAVADVDAARAADVAKTFGAHSTTDWRELVRASDVDAVVVSTAPALHAEMTVESLESGKHVLCEKPLARTLDECRDMVEAAERSGRFLGTGFNYRFYPSAVKTREILDSGIIGELDHIRSYTGYSATAHDHEWLHDARVMGGGALRDNGIHLIDLTAYFLGEIDEVKGFGTNNVWQFNGCEDNGFALIRNKNGRVATLQASWTEWRGYQLRIEIYGTLGCVRMWCFPMMTQVTWSNEIGGKARSKRFLFPRTQLIEKLKSYRAIVEQSFVDEFEAFVAAANGKQSAMATGRDGLTAIQIAHAATQEESMIGERR